MGNLDKAAVVFASVIGVVTCVGTTYAGMVLLDRLMHGNRANKRGGRV